MDSVDKDQIILQLQKNLRELQRRHALLEFRLQQLELRINRIAEKTGIGEECPSKRVASLTDAELRDWVSVTQNHLGHSPRRN